MGVIRVPDEALSAYVPNALITRSLRVATPFTALATASTPSVVEEMVTCAVEVVQRLPKESCTLTVTAGEGAADAEPFDGGVLNFQTVGRSGADGKGAAGGCGKPSRSGGQRVSAADLADERVASCGAFDCGHRPGESGGRRCYGVLYHFLHWGAPPPNVVFFGIEGGRAQRRSGRLCARGR